MHSLAVGKRAEECPPVSGPLNFTPENQLACRVITSWQEMRPYRAAWDALWSASRIGQREVYSFDWMREAVRYTRGVDLPWFGLVTSGSEVVGIIPFCCRRRRKGRFPWQVKVLSHLPNVLTLRHDILACPDNYEKVLAAAFPCLWAAAGVDCIFLGNVNWMTASIWAQAATRAGYPCTVVAVHKIGKKGAVGAVPADLCSIVLPHTWEEYIRTRKKQWRNNMRRSYRLAFSSGTIELWRHCQGRQVSGCSLSIPDVVAWIDQVEQQCWQRTIGRHLGVHGLDHVKALVAILHQQKALDLAFLLLNGQPVAYCLGGIAGAVCRVYYVGYDARYRALSPGMLLWYEIIRSSIENSSLQEIELSGSTQLYKRELADRREPAYEVWLYRPRPLAWLLYQGRRLLNRAHVAGSVWLSRNPPAEGRSIQV